MVDTIKKVLGLKIDTPEQKLIKSRIYQKQVKEKVGDILGKIDEGIEHDSEELSNFIKSVLQIKGWKEIPGKRTGTFKSKTLIHSKYGQFSSNCIEENGEYINDESGLPANFRYSFSIETGRSIERNGGGDVKYKKGIKGKIIRW